MTQAEAEDTRKELRDHITQALEARICEQHETTPDDAWWVADHAADYADTILELFPHLTLDPEQEVRILWHDGSGARDFRNIEEARRIQQSCPDDVVQTRTVTPWKDAD